MQGAEVRNRREDLAEVWMNCLLHLGNATNAEGSGNNLSTLVSSAEYEKPS